MKSDDANDNSTLFGRGTMGDTSTLSRSAPKNNPIIRSASLPCPLETRKFKLLTQHEGGLPNWFKGNELSNPPFFHGLIVAIPRTGLRP